MKVNKRFTKIMEKGRRPHNGTRNGSKGIDVKKRIV